MISSMVIIRRQWVEHERLVFPLTQVPLEMLQPPQLGHTLGPLFKKPLLWVGIALPWIVLSTHGLHAYFDYIPRIETNTYFELFRETTPLRVLLSFSVIGFTYLVNLEIGFSLWFFHLLMKLQSGSAKHYWLRHPRARRGLCRRGEERSRSATRRWEPLSRWFYSSCGRVAGIWPRSSAKPLAPPHTWTTRTR